MAATDFICGNYTLGIPKLAVKNTSASVAIPAGYLVKLDTSNLLGASQGAIGVILTAAVTDFGLGFAAEAIPAGGYGGIYCVDGMAVWGVAQAAITVNSIVGPGGTTAGTLIAYTATDFSIGISLTTATTALDPVLVMIAKSRNA